MLGDRRYSIVLVIALLVAGGATIGVYRVITDMRTSNRVVTQPVVIAAEDIPEGAALTAGKLSITQLPAAAIPTPDDGRCSIRAVRAEWAGARPGTSP